MLRFIPIFLCLSCILILISPSTATAQSCANPPGYPETTYSTAGKTITYYVPHAAQGCNSSIEGCIATSCQGLHRQKTPVCLDAVRLGKAKYVTLASAGSNYGKYFNLGTITYRSALDGQMHTVPNVVGYVHDTGCAFNGTCSAEMRRKYGFSSTPRPDKIDVCTTICPTCDDKQAGDFALGKNVSRIPSSLGVYDPSPVLGLSDPAYQGSYMNPLFGQPQQGIAVSTGQGAYPTRPASVSGAGVSNGGSNVGGNPVVGVGSDTSAAPGPAVATLVVQSSTLYRGRIATVSWSSLGMSTLPQCRLGVTFPGSPEQTIREENSGSEQVRVPITASAGQAAFRLRCIATTGEAIEKTASVTVE